MSGSVAESLLFLSCDVVGSTAYKQQNVEGWRETFLSFYRGFPQVLGDLTLEHQYGPGFELWKVLGDEMLFFSRVRSEEDICAAVSLWLKAMDKYETDYLRDTSLSTKGGGFIGTFPGPDSQSSIPRDPTTEVSDKGVVELNHEAIKSSDGKKFLYDYFGPGIDTGFRVVAASSQRLFTMTLEVAWAMLICLWDKTHKHIEDHERALLFETRSLKGVWNGREYPIFSIDRQCADPVNAAIEGMMRQKPDVEAALKLCVACAESAMWPSKLYLPNAKTKEFHEVPRDSLEALPRGNSMEGAESVPPDVRTGNALPEDVPLGGN
jgi:hypothetical protein